MVTTGLPLGRPHVMVTNQAYAVPPVRPLINVMALGGGAIETSNDGSTWTAATLDDDENFECAAAFIRCTTAADACIIQATRR